MVSARSSDSGAGVCVVIHHLSMKRGRREEEEENDEGRRKCVFRQNE